MEYANESRDKRLEQYGVNERPVQKRQRTDVLLNGYKSFRSAQTAKHAAQFPATAAKRKRSKAFVPRSSLKRFCQRIARRGETSAKVSGQLRMVCRSWPRCSGDAHLRYLSFIHSVAACIVHAAIFVHKKYLLPLAQWQWIHSVLSACRRDSGTFDPSNAK